MSDKDEEIIGNEDEIIPEGVVFAEPTQEELDALKIELSSEDKEKYNVPVPKKGGRKKKEIPSLEEQSEMTDEDIVENMDDKSKDLYLEFSSFLEDKAKIKQDNGIKDTVPTGIDVLDAVMGGGFALGTMGMLVGQPGSGKSMIAIQTMGSAQRKYRDGTLVAMLDSEEATTTARMSNLGVKHPKIKPYNDITIEKIFKFLEGLCLYKEMKNLIDQPSVVVWDSIANTLSQREREVEDINSAIGYKARLLSLLIPKYVSKLSAYNILFLTVNQLRDNIQIGNFAPAKELKFMSMGKTIPGGNTLKFNAFHLIEMKVKEVLKPEKYGFDGIKSSMWCVKNKLFSPNIPVEIVGNFVTGFSNFWTNFDFMVSNDRIVTGAWNYLVDMPNIKLRTKDMITTYNTNPIFKEAFDKAAAETIKTNIIDKYNPEI